MTNSHTRATNSITEWIEKLLLIAGLFAISLWLWSIVGTAIYQGRQDQAFEREIHRRSVGSPRTDKHPFIGSGGVVGRLEIPRLHLRAIVGEGVDASTLDWALGHIPGTVFPGQNGNVGVAGHRDTLFRDLRALTKDDLILFQTLSGSYAYRVESMQIVKPQDIGVLEPSKHSELTLVTCYPFNYVGSAPDRFVVKARQVPPGFSGSS